MLHIFVDWLMHIVLGGLSIAVVTRGPGISPILNAIILNVIYIGQYLDTSQQRQYTIMLDLLSQALQALCNPAFAFLMAAIHSYFSLSRLKISLASVVLAYYRNAITACIFRYTGFQAAWMLLEALEGGTSTLRVQFAFTVITGIWKAIDWYKQSEDMHNSPQLPQPALNLTRF